MSKTITIRDAAARYIEHLRAVGKSERTLYTYGQDLKLAIEHFGEDKDIARLIPAQVAGFFKSDLVTRVPRSGREKSIITITKTRRVFRQMLVFCKEQGWIATVPLTRDELARVKEPTASGDAEKPARKPRGKKVQAQPPAETPLEEPIEPAGEAE